MNHPLEKRHETCEAELAAALASITRTRETLAAARRTAFALENQDGKGDDAALGKALRDQKRARGTLDALAERHAKLAGEELCARYALSEERQRRERRTAEELKERETSLAARLALAAGQLAEAEARLKDQGAKGRRLMVSPLR